MILLKTTSITDHHHDNDNKNIIMSIRRRKQRPTMMLIRRNQKTTPLIGLSMIVIMTLFFIISSHMIVIVSAQKNDGQNNNGGGQNNNNNNGNNNDKDDKGEDNIDNDGYKCGLNNAIDIVLDPLLTLNMKYQPVQETLAIRVTYAGFGYIAFNFHNSTLMFPAITVIGVPNDQSVGKYVMTGKSMTDVTLIQNNTFFYRNLYDSTINQNETHTILRFTRKLNGIPLLYGGEQDIYLDQPNIMMWAYGSSDNMLGMHIARGTTTFTPPFEECKLVGGVPTQTPIVSSTMTTPAPVTTMMTPAPVVSTMTTPAPVTTMMTPAPVTTMMTPAPVSAMTTPAPVVTTMMTPAPAADVPDVSESSLLDCSYRNTPYAVNGNTDVTLRHMINPVKQTLQIELTYAGMGWVSFSLSNSGKMYPATTVIGLPMEQTVSKYSMTGYSSTMVTLIMNNIQQSSITNPTIIQNDTHSVLTYTRPLMESLEYGEIDVLSSGQPNMFIWAVGNDNTLANSHIKRGNDTLIFDECLRSTAVTTTAPVSDTMIIPPTSSPITSMPTMGKDDITTLIPTSILSTSMTPTPIVMDSKTITPDDTSASLTLDCSYRSEPYAVNGNTDVTLRHMINPIKQLMTIELTYDGIGWVSFGMSSNGKMYPAITVIGLPLENTIQKYNMTGYSSSMVTLITNNMEQQLSLINTSIVQNGTHTVLTYTRPLMEPIEYEEVDVDSTEAVDGQSVSNMFIWAVGNDNTLANSHIKRGNDTISFDICIRNTVVSNITDETATIAPTSTVTKSITDIVTTTTDTDMDVNTSLTLDCSYRSEPYGVNGNADVTLLHMINPIKQLMTIELTYAGMGWVSFGMSSNGKMYPAITVIGLPVEGTVSKYNMSGYASSMVTLINNDLQQSSLTSTSIIQNETHTVLTYTRPLMEPVEFEEVNIDATGDDISVPNMFIWAVGNDNTLANSHIKRGNDTIPFDICIRDTGSTKAPTTSTAPSTSVPSITPTFITTTTISDLVTSAGDDDDDVDVDVDTTGALDCSYRGTPYMVEKRDDVSLRHMINPINETVTIELTYAGIGWVSLGFSTTGKMYPAITIVGLPEDDTVSKYDMTGYASSLVTLIDNELQQSSLTGTSIVQNDTHTVLTYTRPLIEDKAYGEVDVSLKASNMFIWGVGNDNILSNSHIYRGSDTIKFDQCLEIGQTLAPTSEPVPSIAPTKTPVVKSETAPGGGGGGTGPVELTSGLTTNIVGNVANKTVTIELTYEGLAWLSWSASPDGNMAGSIAVIGSPDLDQPYKYDMSGRSLSTVVKSPDSRQTLIDPIFTQNATHTYMKFTKIMEEDDEQVVLSDGNNIFLWAIGTSNSIAMHVKRAEYAWEICDPTIEECGQVIVEAQEPERKKLWLAHGVFMALAWVLLVPSAVAASLLRSLLPKGPLWFNVHKYMNMSGILFTIIGFALGVAGVQAEEKAHFKEMAHYKTGLVIFIFALFQALNGIFKPAAPAPPPAPSTSIAPAPDMPPPESAKMKNGDDDNNNSYNDDDNNQNDIEKTSLQAASIPTPTPAVVMPPKSIWRLSWEIYHRILGFALIGISWYNCDTGFRLYSLRYEENSTTPVITLWGCIGGMIGFYIVMYTYSKTK